MSAGLYLHSLLSLKLDAREAYKLAHAYRAEELSKAADELERTADEVEAVVAAHYGPESGIGPGSAEMLRMAGRQVRDMGGKDTGDATQAPAGESTQAAVGTCGRAQSTGQPCPDHPFVPRTEREHWADIADALNAAGAAGIAVGIDMEGILTDHIAWAVVWNREQERWEVGGYEDDSPAETPADAEDWVICCSPKPRCPNGERRARAVERGWTQNGRAGNWLCATHSPSTFFRPGRTYSREHHGDTVLFRVEHLATSPDGQNVIAFGWRHHPDEGWTPGDADDMDGWTEAGEVR